jgi:hypothetical protein
MHVWAKTRNRLADTHPASTVAALTGIREHANAPGGVATVPDDVERGPTAPT